MSPKPPASARRAAICTLAQVLDKKQSLADQAPVPGDLSPRDQAFARHLCYGVLRWLGALDWLARQLLKRPLKSRDQDIHRLLLLGLLQLWQDETPPHAAVHATAETARELNKPWAVGLVNAVLRSFQRDREALLQTLAATDQQYAHPGWLLEQLRTDWPGQWQDIAHANNQQAPLWLRVNRRRTDLQTQQDSLLAAGLQVSGHPLADAALQVTPAMAVQQLPGFATGLLSVQDPAAQLAATLLACRDGDRVLDACAAPGGKTCHLLELPHSIRLTAIDQQAERIALISENLQRLGLEAELLCEDASEPVRWWDGTPFQRILLDAPCSASGVIRRHPEIKWLRSQQQVTEAAALQQRLLTQLWPLLDAGGILVYATCSVLKIENQQQIQAFIDSHGDARCIGPNLGTAEHAGPWGQQFLPGQEGMDGFFYAVLQKSS